MLQGMDAKDKPKKSVIAQGAQGEAAKQESKGGFFSSIANMFAFGCGSSHDRKQPSE